MPPFIGGGPRGKPPGPKAAAALKSKKGKVGDGAGGMPPPMGARPGKPPMGSLGRPKAPGWRKGLGGGKPSVPGCGPPVLPPLALVASCCMAASICALLKRPAWKASSGLGVLWVGGGGGCCVVGGYA